MVGRHGLQSILTAVDRVEEGCNTENVDALHRGKYPYLSVANPLPEKDRFRLCIQRVQQRKIKRLTHLRKKCKLHV